MAIPAAGSADQLAPARERAAWEIAAEDVWKALKRYVLSTIGSTTYWVSIRRAVALCSLFSHRRHPYVDLTKPTVIADFWRPVAQVDPSIAA